MKRMMISLLGALAFAAVAQAAEPQTAPSADTAPAMDTALAADTVTAAGEAKKPGLDDRNCLRDTGTRISSRTANHKDRKCTGANGRSYSRNDLQHTGEVDIADALRKLDPSIH